MTRTEKWTNAEERYFTHNGHPDEAPDHVKKDGFGKGNWGKPGDEIQDLMNNGEIPEGIMHKQRRGSNTSTNEERFAKVHRDSIKILE